MECQEAALSECNYRECEWERGGEGGGGDGGGVAVFAKSFSSGITALFHNWLMCFYSVVMIGPQNHPCVQRHPGVPGSGRGGGVYGGLDHIHKEPGTRSVLMHSMGDDSS